MPIVLRPLDKIVEKWRARASAASGDYAEGVAAPKQDWQKNTLAASDAWKAGVTEAAAKNLFAKGVAATPTDYWKTRATTLGTARFSDGVSKSVDVYKSKFAPYYDVLSKLELPPRGARGDPKNIERVRAIITALRSKKVGT
ncbi:MAG: hypothetical protein QXG57_07340 [Thermofilaceae archaeon]